MKPFTLNGPTDKAQGAWHGSYLPVYSRLLESLRETTNSILEIGTDGGFPLLAYREWFHDAKMAVGVDVNPPPQSICGKEALQHYQMDAYTSECIGFLNSHGPYACMIDDGSHFLHHQIFFVEKFGQLLSKDGIAIVEDIQNQSHIDILYSKLPKEFLGFAVDLRLADSRYDSLLFCFQRK